MRLAVRKSVPICVTAVVPTTLMGVAGPEVAAGLRYEGVLVAVPRTAKTQTVHLVAGIIGPRNELLLFRMLDHVSKLLSKALTVSLELADLVLQPRIADELSTGEEPVTYLGPSQFATMTRETKMLRELYTATRTGKVLKKKAFRRKIN